MSKFPVLEFKKQCKRIISIYCIKKPTYNDNFIKMDRKMKINRGSTFISKAQPYLAPPLLATPRPHSPGEFPVNPVCQSHQGHCNAKESCRVTQTRWGTGKLGPRKWETQWTQQWDTPSFTLFPPFRSQRRTSWGHLRWLKLSLGQLIPLTWAPLRVSKSG